MAETSGLQYIELAEICCNGCVFMFGELVFENSQDFESLFVDVFVL